MNFDDGAMPAVDRRQACSRPGMPRSTTMSDPALGIALKPWGVPHEKPARPNRPLDQRARLADQLKARLTAFGQELVEAWSISLHHTPALHQRLVEDCLQTADDGEAAIERLVDRQLKPAIVRELAGRINRGALPLTIFLCANAQGGFVIDYVDDEKRLLDVRLVLATQTLARLSAHRLEEDPRNRRSADFWAAAKR